MLYNAVIRDLGSPTILARVFVKKLEDVPNRGWMIEYRGCLISRTSDLGALFVNDKEPLHLVRLPGGGDEEIVYVSIDRNREKKVIAIPVMDDTTVDILREKIENAEGIPRNNQRLEYCGERLEGERALKDYDVNSHHVIELRLPLTGGGPPAAAAFLSVDVEGKQIKGHCIPVKEIWQMYDLGMNIYGFCPKQDCPSKSREVVINMKYGRLRLEVGKCNFPCSACKTGLITPANFLVTRGRALFRYKKAGLLEKVKIVLLESLGSFDEYKTFADPTISNEMTKYDFIEVTCVGVKSSPFHCVCCNFAIEEKEVVLNCGHVVHPNCLQYSSIQKTRRECEICKAKCCKKIPEVDDSVLGVANDDYVDVMNHPTSAAQDEWRSDYEEMRAVSMTPKKEVTWNLNNFPITRSKIVKLE